MNAGAVKILMVEDNPVDAMWVKRALTGAAAFEFEVVHVETLAEATGCLNREQFHIILLDLLLPDSQGLETFLEIQKVAADTPVVVTSGTDDETLAVEAVRKGAQDYLVKDKWNEFLISRSILYAIERQRLLATLKDTERSLRQSREVERRANRALKALTECNHALVHATEESAFLADVCRLVVETGQYRMAWVGMACSDKAKTVQPVAIAGYEEGYLKGIKITWSDDQTGRGPTGTAIRTGMPKINRNSMTDPDYTPWRSEALARGYVSSIALPLKARGNIFGSLTIYAGDPDAFDEAEVDLLGQLADDVSYGMSTLMMRADKEKADAALRESVQRFRAIFEKSQDCIYLKDCSLKYTLVNPATESLFGLPASKIIGRTHEDIFGGEGSAYVREVETRVLQGESIEEEHTRRSHGMPMTFLYSRIPLRDNQGTIAGILTISREITERKRTQIPAREGSHSYASKVMKSTLTFARLAAAKESTVLLLGESGSGKDYMARYIHDQSRRSDGPYFSINCAALAAELAESELFGHEKGAFTGAHGRKRGLLELAEGGTLLLNEIGELSLPLQAKLLTFLDTRKLTRVGGEKEISVNARLIAATNKNLRKEVESGRFRKDLYYRLSVIAIEVPPLRKRREDIPSLVQEILSQLHNELQFSAPPHIDDATMEQLENYDWPGNVRELRNVLERSVILSDAEAFRLTGLTSHRGKNAPATDLSCAPTFPLDGTLHDVTDKLIRSLLVEALERSDGNKKMASRLLGISRDTLYRYMKKFGMETDD